MQSGNILPIFILTIIIPIITYFILRNLGVIQSINLPTRRERIWPLLIHMGLLLMILLKVIPNNYTIELYFFFLGLIASDIATLIILAGGFRISLHMLGMGSWLMYLIALSIHFEINIIIALSLVTAACGLVATSRLYFQLHSKIEVILGFIIGFTCQLLTLKFWL